MNKILIVSLIFSSVISAKVEVLDRIAIIVDDGVIMESQLKSAVSDLERRYDDQNIPKPPQDVFLDQIREKLILKSFNFN